MASKRRVSSVSKPSKRESRAAREKRLEFERRSKAAKLAWKRKKAREAAEFRRRSRASKLGHARKKARVVVPKIAAKEKAIREKKRAVKAKRESNTSVYSRAERKRDKEEIERLRKENEDLKKQVKVEDFVNIIPPEWTRDDGSIALNRCRLRHTEDADQIQKMLREAYDMGGESGVKRVVRNLADHYEDSGDYPEDDPMSEHEIWTLFFSP